MKDLLRVHGNALKAIFFTIQKQLFPEYMHLRQVCMWSLAAAIVATSLCVQASEYSLQLVVQPGDVIDGRTVEGFANEATTVAINNLGEIAFHARVSWGDNIGWGLMTTKRFIAGARKDVGGIIPRFSDDDHTHDINDQGDVAYTAFHSGRGIGVFRNDELLYQTGDVVGGITIDGFGRDVDINKHGQVSYYGITQPPGRFVAIDNSLVIRGDTVLSGEVVGGFFTSFINDIGDTVFMAVRREEVPDRADTAVASPGGILIKPGDVIDGVEVDQVFSLSGILNDGTVVATVVTYAVPGRSHADQSIVTLDEVLVSRGDVIDGILFDGLIWSNVSVNEFGQLAFLSESVNGQWHLFAGGKLVVSEGDFIDGRAIDSFFQLVDMNDRGDVAFRVAFDDGSHAIVAAWAVPEPIATPWCLVVTGVLVRMRRRVSTDVS